MKRGFSWALLACCGLLLLSSCDSIQKAKALYNNLLDTQKAVVQAINWTGVTLNISTTSGKQTMTVDLINCPIKDLPDSEKTMKARAAAQAAYDTYPSRADLEKIQVVFEVQKDYAMVHLTNGVDAIAFKGEDLAKTSKVKPGATPSPQASPQPKA